MSSSKIAIAAPDDPRWRLAREGDLAARNSLVEEHYRLVGQVASVICRGLPAQVEKDDLISCGAIGLIKAVETFDPERASFRTHAAFLIRINILDGLREVDWVPKNVRQGIRAVGAAERSLRESNMENSIQNIARESGLSESEVSRSMMARRASTVVYANEHAFAELPSDEGGPDAVYRLILRDYRVWAESLDPLDQAVWALRSYKRYTKQQTARLLGIDDTAVSASSRAVFESFRDFVDTTLTKH